MKIYICDDNREQLEFYKSKLLFLAKKFDILMEISTFENGESMLFSYEDEKHVIDAIYLDINMPGMSGVEAAAKLKDSGYTGEIIFLTVSKDHFLSAFDLGAFNYIIKNETTEERFELVFLRAVTTTNRKNKEYIVLIGGGERKKLAIDDIAYYEVEGKMVTVYFGDNEEFRFLSSIGKIEENMYGKGFLRVHRSFLVGKRYIKSYSYDEIELHGGQKIPIGRTYRPKILKEMKKLNVEAMS